MKILAIEKESPNTASVDFESHLNAEAAKVWELYQKGTIRELYFRADITTAILILECEDIEEAQEVLSTLPLVEAGLITFDIIPLVSYPGFARLFAEDHQ